MSIFLGSGSTNPSQLWFGNNPLREVWVGSNKVWPTGPKADAKLHLNFDRTDSTYLNVGTEGRTVTASGGLYHDHDNLYINDTGRLTTTTGSTWNNGFTISMWTKDAIANSGWRTVFHRAPSSGSFTTEAYVVQNTNATATTIHSGLRLNGAVKEFASTIQQPISGGWFHTVVTWSRTSATSFGCLIYINGTQRGAFGATGYPSNVSIPSSYPLYIGSGRDNDGFMWAGSMDDLLVWDRPLTSNEVSALYSEGRSWVPRILTYSPINFVMNEPGSMSLSADFSVSTWSATGLPAGISLSPSGVLSGTATTVGTGVMVVTAVGGGYSATKAISWTVENVQNLPSHGIKASGASKVSHDGWNRPALTWSLISPATGGYSNNGTLGLPRGRGRIRFTSTLSAPRSVRIVSDIRGVLTTAPSTSAHDFYTPVYVFEDGEGVYVEFNGYSSNTNDRLSLFTVAP